jgi:hypothetical protein
MASRQKPFSDYLFLATAFLAAFLLFQVQPLVSKRILPWFGGTPSVWNTCLLFFQLLLLAGYSFAHVFTRWLPAKWQLGGYVLLLAGAACVPILPSDEWKPMGVTRPTLHIVQMLLLSVGPAFFVLAVSSPLIQSWFVRVFPGKSPYHLYAVGNAGSLLALLSYPFVIEPLMSVPVQAHVWRWTFVAFLALACYLAWMAREKTTSIAAPDIASTAAPDIASAARLETTRAGRWFHGGHESVDAEPGGSTVSVGNAAGDLSRQLHRGL